MKIQLPALECVSRAGGAAALALLWATAVFARDEIPPIAPKDHYLFVGTDYLVSVDGKYRRVVSGGNGSLSVEVERQPKKVLLRRETQIQLNRGLKLSGAAATISNLEGRMSSDGASVEQFENTQMGMALNTVADQERDFAHGKMLQADMSRPLATNADAAKIRGFDQSAAASQQNFQNAMEKFANVDLQNVQRQAFANDLMVESATAATNSGEGVEITPELSANTASSTVTGKPTGATAPATAASSSTAASSAGTSAAAAGGVPSRTPAAIAPGATRAVAMRHVKDAGDGRSDRLDFSFEVASPEPLDHAYVLLMTEYTAPDSAGEIYRRVQSRRVDHIDAKPRRVTLWQLGFPIGFHLKNYTISVYANGQEVATNLSENRVALTADEAYQYVFVNYLASHKGETHPPAAVLMAPASALEPYAQLRDPIYVSVAQDGKVVKASADSSDRHELAGPALAALQHFRFIPALDKGVPTSGRAKLVVAEFAP